MGFKINDIIKLKQSEIDDAYNNVYMDYKNYTIKNIMYNEKGEQILVQLDKDIIRYSNAIKGRNVINICQIELDIDAMRKKKINKLFNETKI